MQQLSLKKRLFNSSWWAFFTMLVWEGVECLLEYAIAYFISSAVTLLVLKFVTTFIVVTTTQTAVRPLQRFFNTFFKKIIYRKGEDKVNTLKKIWELMKVNKCSIAVVLVAVLLGFSGSNIINVNELPKIHFWDGKVVEAVVQEEDLIATEVVWEKEPVIATETVYGKPAVIATETIYGAPIFATEVIWEKEPVLATEIIWEVEPVIATETIYSVEPIIADRLTFIANDTIYEEDGITVKYNVGDTVPNNEVGNYADKVDVFQAGQVIKEGTVLYEKGTIVKEGVVKHNIGDVVEEGTVKYEIGDYMGNEILYNVGDVVIPAEVLFEKGSIIEEGIVKFNIGDIMIPAGTVLQEKQVIEGTNITPIIYYFLLMAGSIAAGVFFEKPEDYEERKINAQLKKQAKKELVEEDNKVVIEQEQKIAEEQQKIANAELAKQEHKKRLKIEEIKAEIRANNNSNESQAL